MKKYLVVLLLTVVLLIATVSLASANGGPHGGYDATTDACAGCHRAHTAVGPGLLVQTTTQALCLSCHGAGGSGADSDVVNGRWLEGRNATDTTGDANTAINASLLGGGFTTYNSAATTSTHLSDGSALFAWGNGVNRGASATLGAGNGLDCASCHDPHGSTNYRIIKTTVNSVAVAVAQVDDTPPTGKDYDTEQWGTGQSQLCAACHSSYHVSSAGSGSDAAMVATGGYTHRVNMAYNYLGNANPETVGYTDALAVNVKVPLAETGTNNTVVCQTCHLPHGTSAAMTGFANGGPTGAGTQPGNTTAADSALLRLDNRGVCQACHQKP
jgi:predicted CXXCH cytochrome family protein